MTLEEYLIKNRDKLIEAAKLRLEYFRKLKDDPEIINKEIERLSTIVNS